MILFFYTSMLIANYNAIFLLKKNFWIISTSIPNQKKIYMIISSAVTKFCGNIFLSPWCNPEQSPFSKKFKKLRVFFVLKTGFWKCHVFRPEAKVLCRRCVCAYYDFSAVFLSELLKYLDMIYSPCMISFFSVVFGLLFIFLLPN